MNKYILFSLSALILLSLFPFVASPSAAFAPRTPVQVLQSNASGLTLQLTFDDYMLTADKVDGVACQRLSMPDGTAPVRPVLVGVPPSARVSATIHPLATTPVQSDGPLCSDLETGATIASAHRTGQIRVIDLGYMRSQRIVRLEIPALRVDPATGGAVFIRKMQVSVRFIGGQPGAVIPEPASFEAMFDDILVNSDAARAFRGEPAVVPPELGVWNPPTPAWRVLVKEPGIYEITYQDMKDAGLPVDTLDPRTLKLLDFGREVAITVTGEADSHLDPTDRLLFYGEGVDTRYTDVNVYWLTYGHGQGVRMAETQSVSSAPPSTFYQTSVRSEENHSYVSSLPMAEGHDHWYGNRLNAFGAGAVKHIDYPINVQAMAADASQARISFSIGGNIAASHHIRLYVNGVLVDEATWSGRTVKTGTATFSQHVLHDGQNTLRVELVNDAEGQAYDQVYIDWVQLDYQRRFLAKSDVLTFDKPENSARSFSIEGFTTSELEVYDITSKTDVKRVVGWQAVHSGGGYQLRFGDAAAAPRRYWAQAQAQRKKPLAIQQRESVKIPLASPENSADYIVIFHPDFGDAIKPLLDYRKSQGLRVMGVSTQDIYDEFGYGMMSAEAIRDFLAYAYANWQRPAPGFVLLVGDGTYDMRHYLADSADTFLPPYLAVVDPTMGETAADNRFVSLTAGDILPDMHVGRLPANTPAETTAMVDKILVFENSSSHDAWAKNILFVTDNLEGGGGNFYELSDAIADGYIDPPTNSVKLIPETYRRTKLYLDRTCSSGSDCRQKMTNALNQDGALFVSYIGHGAKTFWAQERIWDVNAASQMTNGNKYPIMLPMTCNEGYFIEPAQGFRSTSEASLRLPHRGAIASWAPTGYGLSAGHDYLERGFFLSIFHGAANQLGPATTAGKLYLAANAPSKQYQDLIDTFLLMGDPALLLPTEARPLSYQVHLPIVIKE